MPAAALASMLTARGDVDEALAFARRAMPLCREDEYVDWLFPHLALRVAKTGRPEDAARLWGYAEHLSDSGVVRQINEQRAVDALALLLRDRIAPDRIEQLTRPGGTSARTKPSPLRSPEGLASQH